MKWDLRPFTKAHIAAKNKPFYRYNRIFILVGEVTNNPL